MASYTARHFGPTGLTFYAKLEPLNTANYGAGVTALPETAVPGIYSATLQSQNRYIVFEQVGGAPTLGDPADGAFESSVWDDPLTAATHNQPTSAGRRLRQLADTVVLTDGETVAADNAGPEGAGRIQLASGTTTACVGQAIRVASQVRYIESYDPATQIAVLDQAYCVVPTAGDEYTIFSQRSPLLGKLATAMSSTFGFALKNLQSLLENVSGWRFTKHALSQVTGALPPATPILVFDPLRPEHLRIVQGNSYTAAIGREITVPIAEPGSFAAGDVDTATFRGVLSERGERFPVPEILGSGSVAESGGDWTVTIELTAAQTDVPTGIYEYGVDAILIGGERVTVLKGCIDCRANPVLVQ